jgi:hypothetical protein
MPLFGRQVSIDQDLADTHEMCPKVRSRMSGLAAWVMVLALTGCFLGSTEESDPVGPGGPDAPAAPDPCQLLSREEVQAVRGGVTAPGEENPGNLKGERVCLYSQENSAFTSIAIYPSTQTYFDGERESVKENLPIEDVDGLGDDAFVTGPFLYIHKGPFTMVIVASGPGTETEARERVLKLGAIAIKRI